MKQKTKTEPTKTFKTHWTDKANEMLKGSKIIRCEYLSQEDCERELWYNSSLAILLEKNKNQFWIVLSQDDEMNDGGSLIVHNDDGWDTLPRISTNFLNKPMP